MGTNLPSPWKKYDPKDNQEFDEVGRGYWECPGMDEELREAFTFVDGVRQIDYSSHEHRVESIKAKANLLSSLCKDGQHRPVLDIDVKARFVPSSTEGHGHLYIDHPLTWEQYEQVLIVLAEVGILEKGYVGAAISRKATFVRPEGVKKPPKEET